MVKQMLHQAKLNNYDNFLNNTIGLVCARCLFFGLYPSYNSDFCMGRVLTVFIWQVFYSCPHFGSKLADMPWRMGYVLRPAPSVRSLCDKLATDVFHPSIFSDTHSHRLAN